MFRSFTLMLFLYVWIQIDSTPNPGVLPQSACCYLLSRVFKQLFYAFCPGLVVIFSERGDMKCAYSILPISGTLGIIIFRASLNLRIRFQVSDCHVKVPIRSQNLEVAINPIYLNKYFPLAIKKKNPKHSQNVLLIKHFPVCCCSLRSSPQFRDGWGEHPQ